MLAIVAYHEPVSRAEIEAIRGVQTAKGTLDVLMEAGWVRIVGRRSAARQRAGIRLRGCHCVVSFKDRVLVEPPT